MSHNFKHFYEFEEFRLDAENPSLWRDNKLVSISPKTLGFALSRNGQKMNLVSR